MNFEVKNQVNSNQKQKPIIDVDMQNNFDSIMASLGAKEGPL